MLSNPLALAMLGTGFTFAATAVGAAAVFFLRREGSAALHRASLGFAAGVMIAASIWSLLLPAQEMAAQQQVAEWLPTTLGFLCGGAFLFLLDHLLPHLHAGESKPEGIPSRLRRTTLLVLAVTLHNLPEGMPMAEREPAGVEAWAALPTASMRAPSGAAVTVTPAAWGSCSGLALTTAQARSGTTLVATPPPKSTSRPPPSGALTKSPLLWPFSPLPIGNAPSGVNVKSGAGWLARYGGRSPMPRSSSLPSRTSMVWRGACGRSAKKRAAQMARIAGPLSSEMPRPISQPSRSVSV